MRVWRPVGWILLGVMLLGTLAGVAAFGRIAPQDFTIVYLPYVGQCGAQPAPLPASPNALVRITPNQPINASTYNPGSFIVSNDSAENAQLIALSIDLSTALLPDIVFDPNGGAGDQVAKDFTLDVNVGDVAVSRSFEDAHDGGFYTLALAFGSFDPGDEIRFSIDVDPTSIKGGSSPGPGDSGSVSGLEMAGATIVATFRAADNSETTITAHTYPVVAGGFASESRADVRAGLPAAPDVAVVGGSAPAVVSDPVQWLTLQTLPEARIKVIVFDANLYTDGLPNGGFDLDPFEANTVVGVAAVYETVASCLDGSASLAVTLTDAVDAQRFNYIVAVVEDGVNGVTGAPSAVVVFDYEP